MASLLAAREPVFLPHPSQDRHHLGAGSYFLDSQPAVYILTLGVSPKHRNKGLAMQLLNLVHQEAVTAG